jgi:hypothetical protein
MRLLAQNAEALMQKCIDSALGGDMLAMKLCVERIYPARRGGLTSFDLPALDTAAGIGKALEALLTACSRGQLTPDEVATLAKTLDAKSENLRVSELETRLIALERARSTHLGPVG